MADVPAFSAETTPTLQQLVDYFVDSFYDEKRVRQLQRAMTNATAEGQTVASGAIEAAGDELVKVGGSLLQFIERLGEGVAAEILAHVVAHLLGIVVPPSALQSAFSGTAENPIGKAVGQTLLSGLRAPAGELKPGEDGAVKLLGMLAQFAVSSWFEGTALVYAASKAGLKNPVETMAQLGHSIVETTGMDNLGRLALRPMVDITVATPLEWQAHKTYRPKLLSAQDALRQFASGHWSDTETREELARLGYSDKRIDALLQAQTNYLSLDDALALVRNGAYSRDFAQQMLREQGYSAPSAELAVLAAETRRLVAIHDDSLGALKRAYAQREITDAELSTFLHAIIYDDAERAAHEVAAQTVRELTITHLSHAQVVACVKAAILPRAFYREWLRRENYPPEEAFALELLLAADIQHDRKVEELRAELEAEHAAEKDARAADRAARKADVERQRALARRGSLADLERAVVRGLIPIARYTEVAAEQYDADTVAILVELVEDDRAHYLDAQQRAEDARKRAAIRHIDVGALDQAVLEGVLTLDEYRQRLAFLTFPLDDVAILANTLAAKKAARDDAFAQHAAAEEAAKRRLIDLPRFETLVRRGHRTVADYEALLRLLGFDEASRAAMDELLQLKIADDTAARAAREAAAGVPDARGVTLDQVRRAVLLGTKTVDDFQTYLVDHRYTTEAQIVLLDELRADVAQAEAARQKRAQTVTPPASPALPLSRVARAARLGVVSPAVYEQRLVEAGYSADDIAIELDLLLAEIAAVQATRATEDAGGTAAPTPGLSLSELARAVKAGAATVADYRTRAAVLGYAPADVETLGAVLEDELAAQADAEARRATIDAALQARNLSLAQLEASVKANLLTLDDYQARIVGFGFARDDAELLTALLANKLLAPSAAA